MNLNFYWGGVLRDETKFGARQMIMSGEEREQESKPLICAFGKQNQLDPATQVNTLKVSQG